MSRKLIGVDRTALLRGIILMVPRWSCPTNCLTFGRVILNNSTRGKGGEYYERIRIIKFPDRGRGLVWLR